MEEKQQLPKIFACHSLKIMVEPNKKYLWCACGLSQTQPFCDNSHKGTDLKPVVYESDEIKLVGFCACKYTKTPPLCDGTHKNLQVTL